MALQMTCLTIHLQMMYQHMKLVAKVLEIWCTNSFCGFYSIILHIGTKIVNLAMLQFPAEIVKHSARVKKERKVNYACACMNNDYHTKQDNKLNCADSVCLPISLPRPHLKPTHHLIPSHPFKSQLKIQAQFKIQAK